MVFQHGKLNEVGAVEHDIGRFLIGINPFLLCIQHILPVGNGLACGEGTGVVVPYDAPQQAVVTGGNAVVVVQEGSGERIDENLELGAVRNLAGKAGIEGVDAFDEEDTAFSQFEFFPVVFPQAGYKIKLRNAHFLSIQEFHDIAFHQPVVHRLEVVEIVGTVREFGGFYPVDKIVIRTYGHGMEAAGFELDGQALAEGGFPGRGRAGDKDHLQGIFTVVATVDFFGDLDYLFLLQGFRYLDKLAGLAVQEGFVHVSHGA